MNRYCTFLATTLLLFCFSTSVLAQFEPAPVEKSKQKILLEGKVFYIHTVKANQTLSSISRVYGVTIQDIAVANPNIVLEVISVGQTLRIPSISALSEMSESYFGLTKDDFIYHTVQPQQTVHFLSKKYNVTKDEIYYYNPGSQELIQVGQVIKIPKAHVQPQLGQKDVAIDSNAYIVKKVDTLYSLSKKYGISIAELIKVNPQLRWGLKEGMALSLESYGNADGFNNETTGMIEHSIPKIELFKEVVCDSIKQVYTNRTVKIAMLLPLHASEIMALDTITNDSLLRSHPNYRYRSRGYSFAEFYEGFVLAIDSLKRTGLSVSLFSYDTKSDSIQTDKILRELEIIKPDIIYGPILPYNISRVSAYSEKNKIPLVLPLAKEKARFTNGNPYAISLIPDYQSEMNGCADYLSQFNDRNIILIHDEPTYLEYSIADEFKETLFAYFSSKATYESAIYKEIRINDTLKQNLKHALRNNMQNAVVLLSSNEANVSNVIGQLRINQSLGYNIDLFGLPVWRSFNNLRIELLHMLNTVVYSPFNIDYSKSHTNNFLEFSRDKLGYEPYKTVSTGSGFNFTYLGYEAAFMFGQAYEQYGDEFLNCICHLQFDMPQSLYRFEWDAEGGFSNTSINFINYTTELDVKPVKYNSLREMNNESYIHEDVDVSPFLNSNNN